jgi:hypothetical protein
MRRIWLGIGVLALSGAVAAQVKQEQPSLGAVAKATKEQRAKAKAAADAKAAANAKATANAKAAASKPTTYTNENLDGRPRPVSPTTYRAAVRSTSLARSSAEGKDETYWRRRAQPIRQQLEYNTDRLNMAKKRLESLKADEGLDVSVANGRSSPVQAERQRLTSYVQELEYQVRHYEQAMKNLEDEGRKAGALPGWFR